jgi:hypothetical protein
MQHYFSHSFLIYSNIKITNIAVKSFCYDDRTSIDKTFYHGGAFCNTRQRTSPARRVFLVLRVKIEWMSTSAASERAGRGAQKETQSVKAVLRAGVRMPQLMMMLLLLKMVMVLLWQQGQLCRW